MELESEIVATLFEELMRVPVRCFPSRGRVSDVPEAHGVYVIYDMQLAPLHVGKSNRGKRGLLQRLQNHIDGRSSFVVLFFDGYRERVRSCKFRFLPIDNPRLRTLVEALAIGKLCPAHVGTGHEAKRVAKA